MLMAISMHSAINMSTSTRPAHEKPDVSACGKPDQLKIAGYDFSGGLAVNDADTSQHSAQRHQNACSDGRVVYERFICCICTLLWALGSLFRLLSDHIDGQRTQARHAADHGVAADDCSHAFRSAGVDQVAWLQLPRG